MSELPIHYSPNEIEEKWYDHWEKSGYFRSVPDDREAYSVVIPPPNVTGVLHMGHMLNNTIQDVLIRKARMDGKNACWVPGTDHASIATEAKVVKMLRAKGVKKSDLSRDEFLEHAHEWKREYGGIILKQLRKLGASCDWDRTAFTLDDTRNRHVIKAFIDLHKAGKLYRDYRMVNWDPKALTVLSNEEVIYKEEKAKLYTVRYNIENSDEYICIATTRPETIMGDTAVAVHPEDPRYAEFSGKNVVVPLCNRAVPVIFDDYVEREFGTGALKVTPAHDVNDYEIGKRHNLETIDVLNDDGTLNEYGGVYKGMSRFVAREEAVKELERLGLIEKIEDLVHNVGRSERTNALVEPKLSLQWYVDMKSITPPALEAVMEDVVKFHPEKYKNIYRHWMENIRDWCISRQLWWGQRIPAYYIKQEDGEEMVFVADSREEALATAMEKLGREILSDEMYQDEDVLDTWFSSWLWPISVFDGFFSKEELDYYYPTAVLVTGWDIIFLWVARMVMAGYEWKNEKPFQDVYFTGMVRDSKRRKMSKQLGNSPDALGLIAEFGADAVRFGMMSCSPAGGDLIFDEKLIQNGRNFCNKMWNALRLIDGWEVDEQKEQPASSKLAYHWFKSLIADKVDAINNGIQTYRLSEAVKTLYSFIWSDFCSWYLEMIKSEGKIDSKTKDQATELFQTLCRLLHPFMPFITEEIWHKLNPNAISDLTVTSWPKITELADVKLLKEVDILQKLVSKLRELRNKYQLKRKHPLEVFMHDSNESSSFLAEGAYRELIFKMGFLESIKTLGDRNSDDLISFSVDTEKFYVVLEAQRDTAAESKEMAEEIARLEKFESSILKKLGNARFVDNAPAAVVELEKKKLADTQTKLSNLRESLA